MREKILDILKSRAVRKGDFILASGERSPFYIDIKNLIDGEFLTLIGEYICDIVQENFKTFNFGGVELGAVPLVVSAVISMKKRGIDSKGIIIRKNPKEHGLKKWIEGPDVKNIILLEDVITTGGTIMKSLEKLKEEEITVDGLIAIVDRGGLQNIKKTIEKSIAIFKLEEII